MAEGILNLTHNQSKPQGHWWMCRNQYKHRLYSCWQRPLPYKSASYQHFHLTYFSLHVTLASSGHTPSRYRGTISDSCGTISKRMKILLWSLWSVFYISKGSRLFLDSALPMSALSKDKLNYQMHQRYMALHRKVSAAMRPRLWTCAM